MSFELVEPTTIDEVFQLLSQDAEARPMGGGTALMLMMKAQLYRPERLVSLRRLGPPFTGLALSSDGTSLRIGAMTTFSELEISPLVLQHFPVIASTMKTLANIRVRNVATVGGNIAHADPHLDLPPVWVALDAELLIVGARGSRILPIEQVFQGYYETTLEDGEIIAELRVPVRSEWRSRYVKVTTRAIHDWPALGIALSLKLRADRLEDARVVLSAALDKPTRLRSTENALKEAKLDETTCKRVSDLACSEAAITSDSRGSASYKRHLLGTHLQRALLDIAGSVQ